MQHILRCWESQSDGSEYKKTLRRPGLRPRPRWGNLQRSLKPPSWWGGAGCPLPKNPIPNSRPCGPRLFCPTPKLVPTPLIFGGLGLENSVLFTSLVLLNAGDVVRWEQQIRFRHMTTRQYLCITSDRRVTLTPDSKDPRTVFRLHPVIKVRIGTVLEPRLALGIAVKVSRCFSLARRWMLLPCLAATLRTNSQGRF